MDTISNSLVVALGLILLWHFGLIYRFGEVTIYEKNRWILEAEIAMAIGILIFGIIRLLKG